jgi:hypothetical protein
MTMNAWNWISKEGRGKAYKRFCPQHPGGLHGTMVTLSGMVNAPSSLVTQQRVTKTRMMQKKWMMTTNRLRVSEDASGHFAKKICTPRGLQ